MQPHLELHVLVKCPPFKWSHNSNYQCSSVVGRGAVRGNLVSPVGGRVWQQRGTGLGVRTPSLLPTVTSHLCFQLRGPSKSQRAICLTHSIPRTRTRSIRVMLKKKK